ncbi:MAG: metallophosphoesterase family protein [Nitrospirota bacterium]
MRLLILSDIHSNLSALKLIDDEEYDYLICLGDLVDYGPFPKEVIDIIRSRAYKSVRGNHDNALGYGQDCGCSYRFKHLSIATREYQKPLLNKEDIDYLRGLPLRENFELMGYRFFIAHASPKGDLFTYLRPDTDDEIWKREIEGIDADFIFVGHTHVPLIKYIDGKKIVNPGSLGQPRDKSARSSYAIWEDGEVYLRRRAYNIDSTIEALESTELSEEVVSELSSILVRAY